MFSVYCATSPSGKRYVGMTSGTIAERWSRHCRSSRAGSPTALHRAIRKYGRDAFVFERLERMTTRQGVALAERLWIARLNTRTAGYNETTGGEGLRDPASRVCAEIADKLRGRPFSDETRRRMSESARARSTPEYRARIAAAVRLARRKAGV